MNNWERQLEKINLKTADDEMLDFKRKSARIYKNLFKSTEEAFLFTQKKQRKIQQEVLYMSTKNTMSLEIN